MYALNVALAIIYPLRWATSLLYGVIRAEMIAVELSARSRSTHTRTTGLCMDARPKKAISWGSSTFLRNTSQDTCLVDMGADLCNA